MSDAGLRGRAAIVTGGASGLGRAVALRLAREGADVCIMSLSRRKVEMVDGEVKYFASVGEIEETQNAIGALGVRCIGLDGDISVAADVARMVFSTVEAFGRLDILVNNAATNVVHPVLDHDDDAWKRVIDVNLFGPYLCVRAALPHLISYACATAGPTLTRTSSSVIGRCVPRAITTRISPRGIPAASSLSRIGGSIRRVGVSRVISSTITTTRWPDRTICSTGGVPMGFSSASRISASGSAAGCTGMGRTTSPRSASEILTLRVSA